MSEDLFIDAVLAEPGAHAPRLLYADWLEERGDPRAEFLRLDCQLLNTPPEDEHFSLLRSRLQELSGALDPDWVALLRRLPVEDSIESALSELESLLDGLNYVVSLGIHRVPLLPEGSFEHY